MEIKLDGKYKTKSGRKVRQVLTTTRNNKEHPVIVEFENGDLCMYTLDGKFLTGGRGSGADLIEISPYEDFQIDEPVYVWNDDKSYPLKRYFAGIDAHGRPTTFDSGTTSWTCDWPEYLVSWKHCMKKEDYEKSEIEVEVE